MIDRARCGKCGSVPYIAHIENDISAHVCHHVLRFKFPEAIPFRQQNKDDASFNGIACRGHEGDITSHHRFRLRHALGS